MKLAAAYRPLFRCVLAVVVLSWACSSVRAADAVAGDPNNAQWAVILDGFFPGKTKGGESKRMNCYLVRANGKWTAALATPTNQGKPVWNTAYLPVDASGAEFADGKLTGKLIVTLAPDPWVPKDQKPRTATITVDATVTSRPGEKSFAEVAGRWTSVIEGNEAELTAAVLQGKGEGAITGSVGPILPRDTADVSYDLVLYNLIPGKTSENFQRRRALSLGVKNEKVVSARLGQMDIRNSAYDYQIVDTPAGFTITPDAFSGTMSFPADTLDGGQVTFTLTLQGQRVHDFVAGTYAGKYVAEDGKATEISGFLRGNVRPGAFESAQVKDDRPWFVTPKDFKAVQPGEHPRLFFRKADVAELRRRADTPDGKVIIKRLRQVLNGSDGESLPTSYNPATKAYEKNGFKARPGSYSITSAATP